MAATDEKPDFLRRFFAEPLARVDRECLEHLASHRDFDWQTTAVLLTTAVTLTLQEYFFSSANLPRFEKWLEQLSLTGAYARWLEAVGGEPGGQLAGLLFWATGCMVTYVALPVIVIKCLLRRRLRDYGISVRGIWGGSWIYFVMFLFMIPLVLYFSGTSRFQHTYPHYKLSPNQSLWPAFVTWELLYWAQFVGLEFFFRGFVLHGTRQRFGIYAILVMTVPYCMIHFDKPLPETLAAIGAGIVLGFMSLKTRSIWLGAALHIAVAVTMDMMALWRTGYVG